MCRHFITLRATFSYRHILEMCLAQHLIPASVSASKPSACSEAEAWTLHLFLLTRGGQSLEVRAVYEPQILAPGLLHWPPAGLEEPLCSLHSLESILCLTKPKHVIREAQMEALQFLNTHCEPFTAKLRDP